MTDWVTQIPLRFYISSTGSIEDAKEITRDFVLSKTKFRIRSLSELTLFIKCPPHDYRDQLFQSGFLMYTIYTLPDDIKVNDFTFIGWREKNFLPSNMIKISFPFIPLELNQTYKILVRKGSVLPAAWTSVYGEFEIFVYSSEALIIKPKEKYEEDLQRRIEAFFAKSFTQRTHKMLKDSS